MVTAARRCFPIWGFGWSGLSGNVHGPKAGEVSVVEVVGLLAVSGLCYCVARLTIEIVSLLLRR